MGNIFRTVFADESVDLPIGVGRVGKYSMTSHTASSKSASSKSETATSTNKRGREDDYDYADEDFTSFPSAQSFETPPPLKTCLRLQHLLCFHPMHKNLSNACHAMKIIFSTQNFVVAVEMQCLRE
jgi:hypothetical protein